jgi:hypothetical protein
MVIMSFVGFGLGKITAVTPIDVCNGSLFPNSECITSPTYTQNCNPLYKEYDYRCTYSTLYEEACDYNKPGNTFPNPECSIDQGYLNTTSTASSTSSSSTSSTSSSTSPNYCDEAVYGYPHTNCETSPTYWNTCDVSYFQRDYRCGTGQYYDSRCDYSLTEHTFPNLECSLDYQYYSNNYCGLSNAEKDRYCPIHATWVYPCAAGYTAWLTRCQHSPSYIAECDYTNTDSNPNGYLSYPNANCPLDNAAPTRRLRGEFYGNETKPVKPYPNKN